MTDRFNARRGNLSDPAASAALVTPDDATDLANTSRGISFAAAGTLRVHMSDGVDITFPADSLAPGIIHPMRVDRVWDTGTTVTGIVVFY